MEAKNQYYAANGGHTTKTEQSMATTMSTQMTKKSVNKSISVNNLHTNLYDDN